MTATLDIDGLGKQFGGLRAIDGVTLSLERGARHALIGPNGAGKTTFIGLLTGLVQPTAGAFSFKARTSLRFPPPRASRPESCAPSRSINCFWR
jgi:branched-chain amino acid transport system ATP-binding protein